MQTPFPLPVLRAQKIAVFALGPFDREGIQAKADRLCDRRAGRAGRGRLIGAGSPEIRRPHLPTIGDSVVGRYVNHVKN